MIATGAINLADNHRRSQDLAVVLGFLCQLKAAALEHGIGVPGKRGPHFAVCAAGLCSQYWLRCTCWLCIAPMPSLSNDCDVYPGPVGISQKVVVCD
jgi:hypothetical protein